MGVNQEWLRTDGKAGSVDLSILARAKEERIKSIEFRTVSKLWYSLTPLDETELQPDGVIAPVHLKFEHLELINGETGLVLNFIKKWATERRHFPRYGEVELTNAIIREGDPLTINDRDTSPVEVAWVSEYVDPSEASFATYNTNTGLWIGEKSFAHF